MSGVGAFTHPFPCSAGVSVCARACVSGVSLCYSKGIRHTAYHIRGLMHARCISPRILQIDTKTSPNPANATTFYAGISCVEVLGS